MAVPDQPVRYQHAMAAEVYALSAHVCSARPFSQRNQFGHPVFELGSGYVVGNMGKLWLALPRVRGVIAIFLALPPERSCRDITNPPRGQILFQGSAIELRQPPRHRKGTDIDQRLN